MPDFLNEKRQEIAARLKELKPFVEEHARLEAAASALDGVAPASPAARNASGTSTVPSGPKRGRPRGSKNTSVAATSPKTAAARTTGKGRGKAGRRKGGGARAAQALALVAEQPGLTIREIAERMGMQQNYLYRVLPSLKKEGKVTQKGRGWHPADAA